MTTPPCTDPDCRWTEPHFHLPDGFPTEGSHNNVMRIGEDFTDARMMIRQDFSWELERNYIGGPPYMSPPGAQPTGQGLEPSNEVRRPISQEGDIRRWSS